VNRPAFDASPDMPGRFIFLGDNGFRVAPTSMGTRQFSSNRGRCRCRTMLCLRSPFGVHLPSRGWGLLCDGGLCPEAIQACGQSQGVSRIVELKAGGRRVDPGPGHQAAHAAFGGYRWPASDGPESAACASNSDSTSVSVAAQLANSLRPSSDGDAGSAM
jgi:hypothetical protein